MECVNDNAYKIYLPGYYNGSVTFNILDLSPYLDATYQADLTTNLLQLGEDDGSPSPKFLIYSSYQQYQVEVQEKVPESQGCTPRLEVMYKPNFVHCIS